MAHETSTDDDGRVVTSFGPTGQLDPADDQVVTEQVAKVVEPEQKPKARKTAASTKALGDAKAGD